jgi:hypothetical protein
LTIEDEAIELDTFLTVVLPTEAEDDMEDMNLRDTRATLLPDKDIEDCRLFDKYLTKLDVEATAPDISLLTYLLISPDEFIFPEKFRRNNTSLFNVISGTISANLIRDTYFLITAFDVIYPVIICAIVLTLA